MYKYIYIYIYNIYNLVCLLFLFHTSVFHCIVFPQLAEETRFWISGGRKKEKFSKEGGGEPPLNKAMVQR